MGILHDGIRVISRRATLVVSHIYPRDNDTSRIVKRAKEARRLKYIESTSGIFLTFRCNLRSTLQFRTYAVVEQRREYMYIEIEKE